MSDPPSAEGQAGKYSVDASGAQGVQAGDHNQQFNYFTQVGPTGEATRPGRITVHGEIDSPYLGLKAFGEDDAAFFFGREKAAGDILERLRRRLDVSQPLIVSGVSGAGKSSLLRAGVLHRMSEAGLAPAPGAPPWPRLVLTPARAPLAELAAHVAPLTGENADWLRASLRANPAGFALTVRAATTAMIPNGRGRLLLVIDQFEQVFTQCDDATERRAFIAALHAAATVRQGDGQVPAALVVLVVRADFEARCAEYEELADAVQDRYLLAPMTQLQLRLAITRPAELAGGSVEPGLVDELLRAVGGTSAAAVLPHVSHALDQAWRGRAEDDVLTLADYERVGGVEDSIAASADRAFGRLTTAQQALAQPVFMRLVTTSSDLVVSAGRATRAELTAGAPAADVDAVVESFAAERLLTVGEDYVEISHEVLLTAWGKLQFWLDGDKIDMARYSRLNADARDWDANERPTSYLYPPERLGEADAATRRWSAIPGRYPALGPVTQAFLVAARVHARLVRRRRILAILALLALTAAATATAIFATLERSDALAQQSISVSRALAGQSLSLADSDPTTAQQLAAAAWRVSPTSQAAAAMTTLLAQQERTGELPIVSHAADGSAPTSIVLAFSPAGDLIATADQAGDAIQLWNAGTRKPVRVLVDANEVNGVAFSPNGKLIAAPGFGGVVHVWNVTTGRPVRTLLTPDSLEFNSQRSNFDVLNSVAFSPNGSLIASGDGNSGRIYLWNTSTGKVADALPLNTSFLSGFRQIAFSPNGRFLATTDINGRVWRWDVATGKPLGAPLPASNPSFGQYSVAFSPDGRLLATANDGGHVRLWHAATGKPLPVEISDQAALVSGIAFSPDGQLLATADSDGQVRFWSTVSGGQVGSTLAASPDSGGVDAVAFSPSGLLASADSNGTVQLWNTAARTPLGTPLKNVGAVSFSTGGSLLTAGGDGYAQAWFPDATAREVVPARGKWAANAAQTLSLNGKVFADLVTAGIRLYRATPTGTHVVFVSSASYKAGFAGATLSPDGSLLATVDENGNVTLWNTTSGKRLGAPMPAHPVPSDGTVPNLAFSPDDKLLATVNDDDRDVRLWNTQTHALALAPFPAAPSDGLNAVAFSPDGRLLVTAASDGTARLWDPATGRGVGTLSPTIPGEATGDIRGQDGATAVAFSPDGKLLAVGYHDGTVQLWNMYTRTSIGGALPSTSATVSSADVQALAFSPDDNLLLSTDDNFDIQPWQTWMFVNPYAAICDETGPPTAAVWRQYESGVPEPAGICAGVPPASRLGG